MKAAIIGSGIGGIATALRLRAKGWQVDIFEKNSEYGGKIAQIQLGNYRFDVGPSLFTQPHLVDELFALHNQIPNDQFLYDALPVICKYWFADGTAFNAYAEKTNLLQELKDVMPEDVKSVNKFLDVAAKKYHIMEAVFLKNAFLESKILKKKYFWKALPHLFNSGIFSTMHNALQKQFKNERTIQLFSRYATYNGSNPYLAPAILNIIPHLEFNTGVFLPSNGMYSIVAVLTNLCKNTGIKMYNNSKVEKILIENNTAKGLLINGQPRYYDAVVSNADVHFTYKNLLPISKNIKNQPDTSISSKSTSALIFNWGIKKKLPMLDVHNIFFSANYAKEFEYLFDTKSIYTDPTVYIFVSGKKVLQDAPPSGENCFVMVNAPPDDGQNWSKITKQIRKAVLAKLENALNTNLRDYIEEENILTPQTIAQNTFAEAGALYGSNSNSRWAAFKRHSNKSKKLKALYFVGGTVHPGGGIPLCLNSAKIVANYFPDLKKQNP